MKRVALVVLVLAVAGSSTPSSEDSSPVTVERSTPSGVSLSDDLVVPPATTSTSPPGEPVESQSDCVGERITFESPPVDLERIEYVTPLGLVSGSHVTPVEALLQSASRHRLHR